jgi:chemotaxis protein CheZ
MPADIVPHPRAALSAAGAQLDAIARDTETATNAIMAAAEAILVLKQRDEIVAEVIKIFEACSFQDIAGQRIRNVIDAMSDAQRGSSLRGPALNGPETAQSEIDRLMAG